MSAELQVHSGSLSIRHLRDEEKALIIEMVRGLPAEHDVLSGIEDAVVEDMNDGGMGSLKFVRLSSEKSRFAKQLREATFADKDGVPVSITINLDQSGHLFELDIFKADNSPLRKFPAPGDVLIR